jgi:hypothetical protein
MYLSFNGILIIYFGAFIVLSCSEENNPSNTVVVNPPVTPPVTPNKPNNPPTLFSVSVSKIGVDYAEIKLDNVTDPDGDTVYLQFFVNNLPVSSVLTLKTNFTINNLKPLQTYEGYVQATDKKSVPLKVSFSFKTKSKITVFSRLYPDLAGGDDILVTKTGEFVSALGLNKYDSLGNIIFYQRIDLPSYGPNYTDLIQCSDGGFVFCNRFNIQKFDKDGNHLWTSEGFDEETVYNSIAELPDGGYLAVGNKVGLAGMIQKFDSHGKKVWVKSFGGVEAMMNCTSIVKAIDYGFIVVGSAESLQNRLSISKIDSDGNILWIKSYTNQYYIWDAEVVQSSDGSLIIGSNTIQENNNKVAWILKLKQGGEVSWQKSFTQGYGTNIRSIIELRNSEIVFIGNTEGYYTARALLVKLSSSGNLILSKQYYPADVGDYAWSFSALQETHDGGLIIIGGKGCVWGNCVEQGAWLLKTDIEGNY